MVWTTAWRWMKENTVPVSRMVVPVKATTVAVIGIEEGKIWQKMPDGIETARLLM